MKTILITGAAGFIGVNTALHFNSKGWKVIAVDNLSRPGSEKNWELLKNPIIKIKEDVLNIELSESIDVVIHLAAQTTVTKSVTDPWEDFEQNTLRTVHLLEHVRKECPEAVFIYASTNKVYGDLENEKIEELGLRYSLIKDGINENQLLDFHSPYGCSKGAADQYVRDYSRIYGLNTVVFRQSCIYGPHQMGMEDQGWVAWFCIQKHLGKPITVFGDGKQVRDVLFVSDLINAYELAIEEIKSFKGQIFNIGGGKENSLSLLEFLKHIEFDPEKIDFKETRPGDQKIFITDYSKLKKLGWKPYISWSKGIKTLQNWIEKLFINY